MKLNAIPWRQLLAGIALAATFYAALIAFADGRAVMAACRALGGSTWLAVLGLSGLNYLLRYARWDYYLRQLGYRVPRSAQLTIYIAGFAFTTTPAKAGEATRSLYLHHYGVTYTHSLAALLVERCVDVLAMLLLAALALAAVSDLRGLFVIVLLLVVVLLQVVHSSWLSRQLARLAAGGNRPLVARGSAGLLQILHTARPLLQSGPLYGGVLAGLLAWGGEGLALYLILEQLGASLSPWLATGVYGMSVLAGAATLVPGGLGGTELAMQYLLEASGVLSEPAISAVIICRVATLWFAVGLGLLAVLALAGEARRNPNGSRAPGVRLGEVKDG
ncbi:MAG: lysylphosphatidylglycerol synthase transmembrane domain-containing protein [Gammaproteobacteria bacterium]|nr:lysylphosphatidylglycerol synthase transmembrane domain-containing protein [Gammaproteobacteria bacterium]